MRSAGAERAGVSNSFVIDGLSLVGFAAVLHGIFLLPMTRARGWAWEHIWLAFLLSGMLLGNWILAFLSLSNPFLIYLAVPSRELIVLARFGVSWGAVAILFGMGMDLIGLSLGYPLIMGLNASVGTFVPLLFLYGSLMFTGRRLLIVTGTAVAIAGIAACSVAGARREPRGINAPTSSGRRFLPGSSLPSCPAFCPAFRTLESHLA